MHFIFFFAFFRHFRYASDGEEQTVLESMREYLLSTIQKTFEVGIDQAECLYQELLQCTRNKNLVCTPHIHHTHSDILHFAIFHAHAWNSLEVCMHYALRIMNMPCINVENQFSQKLVYVAFALISNVTIYIM